MKILCFGEILWDVYPDKKYIGGASLNFAGHMAKHGEEAYMLSALGCDDLGEEAEAVLSRLGISCAYVARLRDKETGKCLVTLDDRSIPSYDLLRDVAYDFIPCDGVEGDFDVLYFGTLALRGEENFSSLRRLVRTHSFGEIFSDVNIRPPFYSRETVRFSLETATVLKMSLEELPTVADALDMRGYEDHKRFAHALAGANSNLKCILITLGEEGAYALDCRTGAEAFCGARTVPVVSTVGAGDSFSAAFLYQYLRSKELSACVEYATRIAGFVVSRFDAVPDYCPKDFS